MIYLAGAFVGALAGWLAPRSLYGLAGMSALSFSVFVVDKVKAMTSSSRISENSLLWLSAAGGAAGALVAMFVARHKTRKQPFRFRFFAVALLQAAGFGAAYFLR